MLGLFERKDVLSGLFYLAAVSAWMRFVEKPCPHRYMVSLVLYVAALLSKSIAVTLPAALLIWHWWKQERITSTDLLRLVPFFIVGLAITIGDLSFYRPREAMSFDYSLVERSLIASRALWFTLVNWYGRRIYRSSIRVGIFMSPTRWLGGIWSPLSRWWSPFGTSRSQFGRGPLVGALFFAVTLSPVLGFVNYGYMEYAFVADRFQYLAGIGVIAVVIGSAAYSVRGLPGLWQKGALGVAAVALVVLGMLTWRQASVYRDNETLNRHIIALNPQARSAHLNLGDALYKQGRYEEALEATRVAVEQRPNHFKTYANLGAILVKPGRFEEAETHLRRAIALNPQARVPTST